MGHAKWESLRILTTVFTVIAIVIASAIAMLGLGFAVGVIVFVFLFAGFFLQGLRNIPADPPRRAIPLFLGAFIEGYSIEPGWTFFPFAEIIFDYRLYNAGQINFEVSVIERTPDRGKIKVEPFFSYIVDKDQPVKFIKQGKEAGVEVKFGERVDERIREWVTSTNEGPLTWSEALQSNGLAVGVLVDKLFPGHLPQIPSDAIAAVPGGDDIPLSAYIRYFTGRPALSDKHPEERVIKQTLDALKVSDRAAWGKLERAVNVRLDAIEKAKRGENVNFKIDDLGIIITVIGLGPITAEGSTADAADKVAEAWQEAQVNDIKTENFRKQVEAFANTHGQDPKAATEAIQILLKLVTKTVDEKQYAVRADNLEAILEFASQLLAARNPPSTIQ